MDIFFTQRYHYRLSESLDEVRSHLINVLYQPHYEGSFHAENTFRMPLNPRHKHSSWVYLSGHFSGNDYHTAVEIRVRPNLTLVILAYLLTSLFFSEALGYEFFHEFSSIFRLLLFFFLDGLVIATIFNYCNALRKKFETIIYPFIT